ncbi:MAG: DUF4446 family protein [Anaerolineae bacterium]|jgi:hypothetical protein
MEIALLVWSLALTVLLVVGIVWVFDLQRHLRRLEGQYESLFSSKDDPSLGAALERLAGRFSRISTRTERLLVQTEEVDSRVVRTVQGLGLVRYSAYEDTGGDQSFSLALLDGQGDGVILSALYGRDATRVYAKRVETWMSSRSLTSEEEQALTKARRLIVPASD